MDSEIAASGAQASRPYRIAHYPVALIDRVALGDGRSVLVRPILPQDAEPLQAFVQRLSAGARYRRFHMGVRELPAAVLRAFTELDYAQHLGLLAEVFDAQERQTVVADARLIIRSDEPVADAAIVVADDWQGLGLGRKLIGKLLQSASRSGLAAVEADVVAENAPMLRLLARLGFSLRARPDDPRLVQARIGLAAARAAAARGHATAHHAGAVDHAARDGALVAPAAVSLAATVCSGRTRGAGRGAPVQDERPQRGAPGAGRAGSAGRRC